MRVDAFALRLRQRVPLEAADLGVRLCQSNFRSIYLCYATVAIPVFALCMATYEIAAWLPYLAIFWLKPWLDRSILFVLARAAFGQKTIPRDLWDSQRDVWWRQLIRTLTTRRLSLWRSFTQPVYQLEGLGGSELRKRVRQIRATKSGSAMLMTSAFGFAESAVMISLVSLLFWFAPQGQAPSFEEMSRGEVKLLFEVAVAIAYPISVFIIEPFYVAAGFAMYLNRRVELEAWDIEQELRRAFVR